MLPQGQEGIQVIILGQGWQDPWAWAGRGGAGTVDLPYGSLKDVPGAVNGADQLAAKGPLGEHLAQAVHGPGQADFADIFMAPDFTHQLFLA